MKTFAYTLGIFAVLLYACDKIENPKIPQYEYDTSLYPGEGHYVQPNFDPLNGDKKRVVIEDYTGHTCGNCPSAAVILDNLANDYPDELIPIAVHSSNTAEQGNSFQFPRPSGDKYRTDFRLPASNTYGKDFNINSNPLGLVNRKINNLGEYALSKSSWATALTECLATPVEVDLDLKINYYPENHALFCHVKVKTMDAVDRNLSASIYLLADTIVDWQQNYPDNGDPSYPTGDVPNYKHKHVFVGALNGVWGENLTTLSAVEGKDTTLNYSVQINDNYPDPGSVNFILDPEFHGGISVVAFVFDSDTKEILQADDAHFHKD